MTPSNHPRQASAIMHRSYKHGWFYHYNLHLPKAHALLADYPLLQQYLEDLTTDCPQEPFESGPRSSKVRVPIDIATTRVENHEVCALARAGLEIARFHTAHMNVQMHMLQHDSATISIETPLWLHAGEDEQLSRVLDQTGPLSGHIDALRVEDKTVWIWDYKPRADKEKYAATQTLLYALMLEKRTGITLSQMRCGYFDSEVAHIFAPSRSVLSPNAQD